MAALFMLYGAAVSIMIVFVGDQISFFFLNKCFFKIRSYVMLYGYLILTWSINNFKFKIDNNWICLHTGCFISWLIKVYFIWIFFMCLTNMEFEYILYHS